MTTPVQVTREPIDQVIRQIRIAMLDRDWNQADLARHLGENEDWVSRRLKRRTDLSVVELFRIAEALSVSARSLIPDGEVTVRAHTFTWPARRSLLPGDRPVRLTPPLAEAA